MPFTPFHKGSTTVKKGATPAPPAAKKSAPPVAKKTPKAGNPIGQGPANQSGFFHNDRSGNC